MYFGEMIIDWSKIDKPVITKELIPYVNPFMSDKQITLMQIALDMGKEYATALSKAGLDEEAMETAVLGFKNELNVLEQLSAGESSENLRYLIMASTKSEFDINDFFDETGSFINYDKLKKFLVDGK